MKKRYDIVTGMIRYETGDMSDDNEILELFQALIDQKVIQHLQGSYQRAVQQLLDAGLLTAAK